MAGHRPWRELRTELSPAAQAASAAWVAAWRDPALLERERRAARLLDGARDWDGYADARRLVRETLGLDPDAVPHDPPPSVSPAAGDA